MAGGKFLKETIDSGRGGQFLKEYFRFYLSMAAIILAESGTKIVKTGKKIPNMDIIIITS